MTERLYNNILDRLEKLDTHSIEDKDLRMKEERSLKHFRRVLDPNNDNDVDPRYILYRRINVKDTAVSTKGKRVNKMIERRQLYCGEDLIRSLKECHTAGTVHGGYKAVEHKIRSSGLTGIPRAEVPFAVSVRRFGYYPLLLSPSISDAW
eukprot:TRINITY_DN1308_c0_g1_i8.p1 TRINITY_DN1308_c0_g1~~TRINITY_DN1308_c0_g1_i8.p1  ORF type:complete len:150 (-),score=10.14 TRINITY_DN1308_c0_g1_i8:224-673(-)